MLSLAIYWEDWSDITGGPLARAYHLLEKINLGPARDSERGPLLEFNVGSHPGDSTHYVNARDMLSPFLLQARLIDLRLPIKDRGRRVVLDVDQGPSETANRNLDG